MPLITLLTDFGLTDVYVGMMKGVIAQINPVLSVIDLTHAIPPQNIALASFQLGNAFSCFPADTVHVVVVDPGVGSERRAIACHTPAGFFVAPNNGVLSYVLEQTEVLNVVELTQTHYWRTNTPSTTFHGRDIFAPVAAHLATGVPLSALGPALATQNLTRIQLPSYQQTDLGIEGVVQAIDHFGNLITNIPASVLPPAWVVAIGQHQVPSGVTYSDVAIRHVVSFIGSHGWLEVAVNGGSAQTMFDCERCDRISIIPQ